MPDTAEVEEDATFTAGPWQSQHHWDADGVCSIIGAVDGPDDGRFLYTPICEVNEECNDWRANAALIAAAPELYEALRALVNSFKPLGLDKAAPFSPLARARKALSKAEGL